MRKKHQKVYKVLNYIDDLLIAISTITGCVSTSDFASLVDIPTGIKKYKSIIKKRGRIMIK